MLHNEAKAELLHIGAKRQCFIWQGCYEARLPAYEARLTPHEAALRAMKRSLDRLQCFCPAGKNWSGRLDSNQRPLRPERSAPTRLSYAPIFKMLNNIP